MCDCSGKCFTSFSKFKCPSLAKVLNFTNNCITDFNGFEPNSNLEKLILDDNPLLSFQGLIEDQKIKSFSAQNTPISLLPSFRQLAILAFGPSIEEINNEKVTISERKILSPEYLSNYFSPSSTSANDKESGINILNKLRKAVRNGWIDTSIPKKLDLIEIRSLETEMDPISVRAMRVMDLSHASEDKINDLFEKIFQPSTTKPKRFKAHDVNDERIAKQQELIAFMQNQLEQLKEINASKTKKVSKKKSGKTENEELSAETEQLYEKLLEEVGQGLIQNSEYVEEHTSANNPIGLRNAVAKLLGVNPGIGDVKLAKMLGRMKRIENDTEEQIEQHVEEEEKMENEKPAAENERKANSETEVKDVEEIEENIKSTTEEEEHTPEE
ncbi:Leucine Rich Repeat family protein [Histomonas meleagridis]|uniref:Leucine Rich Repeat family protein n=1 Tax=Histomonas meleagridis TaxID=135588 RepID=UPI00355ACBB2|nr:Leucine Rich Repeat family protein [Histomonas meleagridis]KAH0802504.1 Leucine Rich Repeat family protein [Histomonas meleagridis]